MRGSHHNHREETVEKAPPWLLSFADVSALLLAFFVMLYSMSTLKTEEYERVISKINRETTNVVEERYINPVASKGAKTISVVPAESPEYLEKILREKIEQDPVLAESLIALKEGRIILSLPSDSIFFEDSAVIAQTAEGPLFGLSGVMSQFSNRVVIVGHADPNADKIDLYLSNWELSLARALSVAHYLNDSGYQQEVTVLGRGDGQYEYLDPKISEERRKTLARRVDLVIYPEAGN